MGWTHIWAVPDYVQYPISDFMAEALVVAGLIHYSPEDGPHASVYRLNEGVSLDEVKEWMGHD